MLPVAATQIGGKVTTGGKVMIHGVRIDGEMANHGIDHTRIAGMMQGHRSTQADQSTTIMITNRGDARERRTEMSPTREEEPTNGMFVFHALMYPLSSILHMVCGGGTPLNCIVQ